MINIRITNVKIQGKGEFTMAKVGIVMGSDSDMPVMAQAADFLEKMGIEFEMTVISAHREPDVFFVQMVRGFLFFT